MQRSIFRIPVIATVALAVVGATPTGQSGSVLAEDVEVVPQLSPTTVIVTNYNPLDIDVVAITEAGRRYRLGSVRGNGGGRSFDLPRDLCEANDLFRLKIYSIGRSMGPSLLTHYLQAVRTLPLAPNTESEIVLRVRSPLTQSFIDQGP